MKTDKQPFSTKKVGEKVTDEMREESWEDEIMNVCFEYEDTDRNKRTAHFLAQTIVKNINAEKQQTALSLLSADKTLAKIESRKANWIGSEYRYYITQKELFELKKYLSEKVKK